LFSRLVKALSFSARAEGEVNTRWRKKENKEVEESARKREKKILILPHWLVKMLNGISHCSIGPQPTPRALQAALLERGRTQTRTTEKASKED